MRVLVVDDEPDVLLLCRVNLEFEGHDVSEALTGEAGMRLALEQHPDLIVLDIGLPKEDGFSVLGRLRARAETKEIPVVLLTARVLEQDQRRGWEMGADDYLTKPFSPMALTETVSQVARMTPQERESRRRKNLERLTLLGRL